MLEPFFNGEMGGFYVCVDPVQKWSLDYYQTVNLLVYIVELVYRLNYVLDLLVSLLEVSHGLVLDQILFETSSHVEGVLDGQIKKWGFFGDLKLLALLDKRFLLEAQLFRCLLDIKSESVACGLTDLGVYRSFELGFMLDVLEEVLTHFDQLY